MGKRVKKERSRGQKQRDRIHEESIPGRGSWRDRCRWPGQPSGSSLDPPVCDPCFRGAMARGRKHHGPRHLVGRLYPALPKESEFVQVPRFQQTLEAGQVRGRRGGKSPPLVDSVWSSDGGNHRIHHVHHPLLQTPLEGKNELSPSLPSPHW